MFTANNGKWAEEQCKNAELGDLRRTKRLIQLTTSLVNNIGASVCKAQNDTAELEAAYRFIRNDNIKADAIADSGFQATAAQVENYNLLLALEDTTTLNVSHDSIRDEMGHITSNLKSRGMLVHSSLLFAPEEQHILGLIDQHRWTLTDKKSIQRRENTKTKKALNGKNFLKISLQGSAITWKKLSAFVIESQMFLNTSATKQITSSASSFEQRTIAVLKAQKTGFLIIYQSRKKLDSERLKSHKKVGEKQELLLVKFAMLR